MPTVLHFVRQVHARLRGWICNCLLDSTFQTINDGSYIITMLKWGGNFGHEWSLPHSLRAVVNGWCSCHNNSCRSISLFWHYINRWKRSENALARHSVMSGLHLVLLLEISSTRRILFCHNDMLVLSPITWKIWMTNNLISWCDRTSFAGYIIVLIVNKAHSLQQESFQVSFNAFCLVCIW